VEEDVEGTDFCSAWGRYFFNDSFHPLTGIAKAERNNREGALNDGLIKDLFRNEERIFLSELRDLIVNITDLSNPWMGNRVCLK
jgi:hypothetical protein